MQELVDTSWVHERLGDADLCILNCSISHITDDDGRPDFAGGRSVWVESHIPGSRHVDLIRDLSDPEAGVPLMMPPVDRLRVALQAAGVADGRQVVLYDDNFGMWAARVWWMLRAVSVEAAVLDGGWRAWTQEGRPVETGDRPAATPGPLTLAPRSGSFVTKADVLAQLDDDSTRLIDALHPRVFSGERQDYARPGHIPGARNVSALGLVDRETHRYLPAEQLRERFAPAAVDTADRVITYCGAGVAGSAAAFALHLLGVAGVAVYDGSLQEWTADPTLPMSTDVD